MHQITTQENIVLLASMTTFKLSKFVSLYELQPFYSVDGTQKLHYVIDIYRYADYFYPQEEPLVYDDTED